MLATVSSKPLQAHRDTPNALGPIALRQPTRECIKRGQSVTHLVYLGGPAGSRTRVRKSVYTDLYDNTAKILGGQPTFHLV